MIRISQSQIKLLVLLSIMVFSCKEKAQKQLPPPEIQVYEVQTSPIIHSMDFVGQTYGLSDIAIRARVEGFLEGIHFEEGSEVKKGDLLYTIDSQPFQAKVAEQRSRVAQAETARVKAKSDLDRYRPLAEINAVSQRDLDAAVASYDAAVSEVKAAEASLRASHIELSYTRIKAPIDGIIGLTAAKPGDFVGREPNPVVLNAVSKTNTILVRFSITEAQYVRLTEEFIRRREAGVLEEDMDGSIITLYLAGDYEHPHKGKINVIDRSVNPETGTIMLQAAFDNPKGVIRPGQFARLKIETKDAGEGILIPQRCVTELQGKFNVNLVNAENKVELKEVKLGHRQGNMWIVQEGLNQGDKIVLEGLQVARPGSIINPVVSEFEMITAQE